MNTVKPTICKLRAELLDIICGFLAPYGTRDLKMLRLVSRSLCAVAIGHVFKRVNLTLDNASIMRLGRITQSRDIGASVKVLCLASTMEI